MSTTWTPNSDLAAARERHPSRRYAMAETERATQDVDMTAALINLAEHALPEDAPGAWLRVAIAEMLEDENRRLSG